MSDRFDVLERFAPLFEAPEPSFDGFLRRRDRKRRTQRITAGVVGIAVFLAAVWLVTSGGPLDRTLRPSTGGDLGPTPPPPHPVGVGLLGFPPEGAPPSIPERGELVVGFVFGHTPGDPGRFGLHVYADGRVIWQRLRNAELNRSSTGWIEQRLTPEGVDLVLDEVLSTGFFHRDRDRELIGLLGGLHFGWIDVRTERLEQLTWGDVGAGEGRQPVETMARPEDVRALERLDARLEDLGSWLPADAWEDQQYRMYVPSRYSVCYSGSDQALERHAILNELPDGVGDLLRVRDTTGGEFRGPFGLVTFWCSTVTTDEARTLAGVLLDAGASRNDPDFPSYRFRRAGGPEVDISFDPLLPDG